MALRGWPNRLATKSMSEGISQREQVLGKNAKAGATREKARGETQYLSAGLFSGTLWVLAIGKTNGGSETAGDTHLPSHGGINTNVPVRSLLLKKNMHGLLLLRKLSNSYSKAKRPTKTSYCQGEEKQGNTEVNLH